MRQKQTPRLQQYPRQGNTLLADPSLFLRAKPLSIDMITEAVDRAFIRCKQKKSGEERDRPDTPEKLVELCIEHLRTRSDPILSSYFVSQCDVDDLSAFDAVSHEMQRHRMSIGIFYQFLLLELMRRRWNVFDGYHEGDIVADIDTPGFSKGLRLFMSVKKSVDTVGGQDIGGVINRLENMAKQEKNLTRPYLCVLCIATPSGGKLESYEEDRYMRCRKDKSPYSLNCEFWGPGFVFPYTTGRSAKFIYLEGIKRVSNHMPFLTLKFRERCSLLLKNRLKKLGLLKANGRIDSNKFLKFSCKEKA